MQEKLVFRTELAATVKKKKKRKSPILCIIGMFFELYF